MKHNSYTIGIDYGTLSGRGVLVRCSDGKIISSAVKEYAHGVIENVLPNKEVKLSPGWCLQHPQDYLDVLVEVIPQMILESKISKEDIIGIGVDFTSCTILPVDIKGEPLCMKEEFLDRRNAYVKLWKHHGAQKQSDKINGLLEEWDLMDDPRFGGKISSELMVPKVMEILEEDPEIYNQAAEIIEAGDWITKVLTGSSKRSCSMAGYKAWWNIESGYPDKSFFRALDERMENFVEDKLQDDICKMGDTIGVLSRAWAEQLGLREGIAVAPAIIDSHAGFPGSGISNAKQMMMVLGTSSVLIALSEKPYSGHGVCGGVKDGIVPGYYALESGLASVGDLFGWFVENQVPVSYYEEAESLQIDIHTLLCKKAEKLEIGESGLIALDWWNGNKTPFVDSNLTGVLIGMSLNTRPEEIYRALIEATAFGTRVIKETFEENGIKIDEIIASGGISYKNPLAMQIYADVLGIDIRLAASDQAGALGSAIYASLAAGEENGGHGSYKEAVECMANIKKMKYSFDINNKEAYDKLYRIYKELSDVMGQEEKGLLQDLYDIKSTVF